MKEWQFNILFFVAVGGAVFLLVAPEIGFEDASNPTSVTGIGAILTYVLTQRKSWAQDDANKTKKQSPPCPPKKEVDQ